ncbi:hypothetical protein Agub_g7771 [Astrephomene gubernaculifera]|uniref:Ankyrin repeat domain-containing protein n=1 Tax=Astrephomene gubernaculifera TaxID=47775 RepID=A0AAD3DTA2_9CHLO|nr:hypothetical protein Agub_g7771 [Astrephomene gubernaculifera]
MRHPLQGTKLPTSSAGPSNVSLLQSAAAAVLLHNATRHAVVLAATAAAAAGDQDSSSAARAWIPDIIRRIASFLPPNEVACSLRLMNRNAAAALSGPQHSTVRLSQPSPPHAFAQRWGTPGAVQGLDLCQQGQLLRLTACSGDIANLAVAVQAVRRESPGGEVENLCEGALEAAAEAGHRHICEWLLTRGCCRWTTDVVYAALRKGQAGLVLWLVRRKERHGLDSRLNYVDLLTAAVHGCDLATVLQLRARLIQLRKVRPDPWNSDGYDIVKSAARSPTADWQAKLEWSRADCRLQKTSDACEGAVECPDAVARLTWLRDNGYPLQSVPYRLFGFFVEPSYSRLVSAAVSVGNVDAVRFLLDEGAAMGSSEARHAATAGHLGVLQLLHARGCISMEVRNNNPGLLGVLRCAVQARQPHVVQWVAGVPGVAGLAGRHSDELLEIAIRKEDYPLMALLHEAGTSWEFHHFMRAYHLQFPRMMEWLAEHGCPMVVHPIQSVDDSMYALAGKLGDTATLHLLRRLGCPWQGPDTFTWCVRSGCCLPVLRWLRKEGCPVDWEAAVGAVQPQQRGGEVERWLCRKQDRGQKRRRV